MSAELKKFGEELEKQGVIELAPCCDCGPKHKCATKRCPCRAAGTKDEPKHCTNCNALECSNREKKATSSTDVSQFESESEETEESLLRVQLGNLKGQVEELKAEEKRQKQALLEKDLRINFLGLRVEEEAGLTQKLEVKFNDFLAIQKQELDNLRAQLKALNLNKEDPELYRGARKRDRRMM